MGLGSNQGMGMDSDLGSDLGMGKDSDLGSDLGMGKDTDKGTGKGMGTRSLGLGRDMAEASGGQRTWRWH